jgi:hypothetical protein
VWHASIETLQWKGAFLFGTFLLGEVLTWQKLVGSVVVCISGITASITLNSADNKEFRKLIEIPFRKFSVIPYNGVIHRFEASLCQKGYGYEGKHSLPCTRINPRCLPARTHPREQQWAELQLGHDPASGCHHHTIAGVLLPIRNHYPPNRTRKYANLQLRGCQR